MAADRDARRVDRELVGPGREAAAALEAIEPRHDRQQRIVGGLLRDVLQVGIAREAERGRAAPNLESARPQQQAVQLRDRAVVGRAGLR